MSSSHHRGPAATDLATSVEDNCSSSTDEHSRSSEGSATSARQRATAAALQSALRYALQSARHVRLLNPRLSIASLNSSDDFGGSSGAQSFDVDAVVQDAEERRYQHSEAGDSIATDSDDDNIVNEYWTVWAGDASSDVTSGYRNEYWSFRAGDASSDVTSGYITDDDSNISRLFDHESDSDNDEDHRLEQGQQQQQDPAEDYEMVLLKGHSFGDYDPGPDTGWNEKKHGSHHHLSDHSADTITFANVSDKPLEERDADASKPFFKRRHTQMTDVTTAATVSTRTSASTRATSKRSEASDGTPLAANSNQPGSAEGEGSFQNNVQGMSGLVGEEGSRAGNRGSDRSGRSRSSGHRSYALQSRRYANEQQQQQEHEQRDDRRRGSDDAGSPNVGRYRPAQLPPLPHQKKNRIPKGDRRDGCGSLGKFLYQRMWWFIILAVLLCVAIGVSMHFVKRDDGTAPAKQADATTSLNESDKGRASNGLSSPPTPSLAVDPTRLDAIIETIGALGVSDRELLATEGTPQYHSARWVSSKSMDRSDERMVQRYALAVFIFGSALAENGSIDESLPADELVGWVDTTRWLSSLDHCNWVGIQCSADGSDIVEINLNSNQINGATIPDEISALDGLAVLDLANNAIAGTVPAALGQLKQLRKLILDNNDIQGELPTSLSELHNLQELRISNNQLLGPIPPLASLELLTTLDLQQNRLTGTITLEDFLSMKDLTEIHLGSNQLEGSIPNQLGFLGFLAGLQVLDLSSNRISGSIPRSIRNIKGLKELRLNDNAMEGTLPAELGALRDLEKLYLHDNFIEDIMPDSVCKLRFLQELVADCAGRNPKVECRCCTSCDNSA